MCPTHEHRDPDHLHHQRLVQSTGQLQDALGQLAGLLAAHRGQVRALQALRAAALAEQEIDRIRSGTGPRRGPPGEPGAAGG